MADAIASLALVNRLRSMGSVELRMLIRAMVRMNLKAKVMKMMNQLLQHNPDISVQNGGFNAEWRRIFHPFRE
ncbi:MAG: hypothetical protein CVU06_13675 [Bacteroidetes bacterium HGW-Bacteroidetes-22]|nr:MAG: hypothetical protein CVU06_13675 [Bacteroidetes bacterium HGW-Bacteroidetes-22]